MQISDELTALGHSLEGNDQDAKMLDPARLVSIVFCMGIHDFLNWLLDPRHVWNDRVWMRLAGSWQVMLEATEP